VLFLSTRLICQRAQIRAPREHLSGIINTVSVNYNPFFVILNVLFLYRMKTFKTYTTSLLLRIGRIRQEEIITFII